MIRINKPKTVPIRLITHGTKATKKLIAAFEASPKLYSNGTKTFKFPGDIYNHRDVKSELRKAHHGKCCYCEKSQNEEDAAVEHFRPKGGYRLNRDTDLKRPGYFWLVYEWDNLYFSCGWCNRDYKENIFPIKIENHRAHKNRLNIKKEKPLLINPSKDFPRKHIRFFGREVPKAISPKGKETIWICGLDRETLNQKRGDYIGILDAFKTIASSRVPRGNSPKNVKLREKRYQAKEFLNNAVKPTAKFSSMAIDFLST